MFEFVDRPQPQHADRAGLAVHAIGDFLEGQPLQIAQDNDVAVLRRELGELIGQRVKLVAASLPNPKATSPADLPLIELLLRERWGGGLTGPRDPGRTDNGED